MPTEVERIRTPWTDRAAYLSRCVLPVAQAYPRRLDVSAAYLTASQRPNSNAAPAAAIVVAVVTRVTSMPVV